jgi:Rrf2 family transcriptional regulator, nitric oxide-sensitive transcriptional repressor
MDSSKIYKLSLTRQINRIEFLMFSQSVDYALRATVCLAMHPDEILTTEQVARITKVPAPYLAKIIKSLGKAGIVASQRGVNGGSRLARPDTVITVLEVMNAVDPLQKIKTCPLGLEAHGINLCPMHHKLNDAIDVVEKVLGASTINELITTPTKSIPMSIHKHH